MSSARNVAAFNARSMFGFASSLETFIKWTRDIALAMRAKQHAQEILCVPLRGVLSSGLVHSFSLVLPCSQFWIAKSVVVKY